MDPLMEAALRGGARIVHLVTVTLPGHTIRWTDGGFVRWDGQVWRARDATFGALDAIGEIIDGVQVDADPVSLTILPPNLTCLADLAGADAQGGWTTIHMAAVDRISGLIVGAPYRLWIGTLDQPRLKPGKKRTLEYDIQPVDARGLMSNEEQRQTDAFHRLVWPDERGQGYATNGAKLAYWREDDPKNSLGPLLGRGLLKDRPRENKAIEFTYDPNAALAFPIGRCALKGEMRYRVGYGPTNRYMTYVATAGASGPIQSLVSVKVDDEVTSFDSYGRATDGAHAGEMWFSFLPGDQPSGVLTAPTGPEAFSGDVPGWTVDHRLSGKPCFMWTGKENSKKDEYNGGLPSVLLTVEGLYGWDPRTGDTYDNVTAWPGLSDGATAALNWVMGRWEGDSGEGTYGVPYACWLVGGIGAPLDGIDHNAFAQVADIADANAWPCAGVLYSDEDKVDILDDLLASAGARSARICGRVSCVSYGAPRDSVMTATAADTAGDSVETVLWPSFLNRRNTGIGRFLSEANGWEVTPIEAVSNPDWVTADGGRSTTTVDLRYQPSATAAAQLTYLQVAHDREGGGEVPFKPWMMALEPGDAFDWAAPEFLLDGIKARVERRRYSPSSAVVRIQYLTETDSKYTDAMAQVGTPPPPTEPVTPPPPYVEPPTDFLISADGVDVSIQYRNPTADGFDHVDLMRTTDSADFGLAETITFYAGSLGEYVGLADPPAPWVPGDPAPYPPAPGHTYRYWPIAVDGSGNRSDPAQAGLPLIIAL